MEETYGNTKCPARGREYGDSRFWHTGCICAGSIKLADAKPDAFDHGKRTEQHACRPAAERTVRSEWLRRDGLRNVRFIARFEHDGFEPKLEHASEFDNRRNSTGRISRNVDRHDDASHRASQEA